MVHDKTHYEVFKKILYFKKKYDARYVRIIPDNSFPIEKSMALKKEIIPLFKDSGEIFWHDKNYGIPEKCWMMWLKPFVNTDRNIYFCCATQMFERKLIEKYRLCSTKSEDIVNTWLKPRVFSGRMCNGGICYYKRHNELIQSLVEGCEHSDFI